MYHHQCQIEKKHLHNDCFIYIVKKYRKMTITISSIYSILHFCIKMSENNSTLFSITFSCVLRLTLMFKP